MQWSTSPPTESGSYRLAIPGEPIEDVRVAPAWGSGVLSVFVRVAASPGSDLTLWANQGPVAAMAPGTRWLRVDGAPPDDPQ